MSDSIQPNAAMERTAAGGPASLSTTTAAASTPAMASNPPATRTANPSSAAVGSATMTITQTETQQEEGVLRLTLQDRVGVRWDESVVDNEGLGRKSSKRCCIFHKARAFGESSTDTSDYDSDGKYSSGNKKIAHKKLPEKKKLPDHLRFHA